MYGDLIHTKIRSYVLMYLDIISGNIKEIKRLCNKNMILMNDIGEWLKPSIYK